MVDLMERKWGTGERIPQMILAGAFLDDIFVIVLVTVFLGMAQSGTVQVVDCLQIPVSILTGIEMESFP